MDIQEAITRTEDTLAARQGDRTDAQKRVEDLDAEIAGLRDELRALKQAASRYGVLPVNDVQPSDDGWLRLNRTAAILRLVGEVDHPMGPKEMANRLNALGRNDNPHVISAAINHLRKSGRLRSVGHGLWVHVDAQNGGLVPVEAERGSE